MTITVEHLAFAYGRLKVLHDITAQAKPGKITTVLGPNAAGKSTLLRCVIGALNPSNGRALINDLPSHAMSAKRLARYIAYVPQRSTVSASFTVRQVVELGRFALPVNAARVEEVMRQLNVNDLADRTYPTLSVGQQQRVALARAIAQLAPGENGHLILDEPTAAMDLRHVASCMRILRTLADGGATVLLAMHDLSLAALIADEAWLMDEGKLIASGSVAQVLTIDTLEKVFGVKFELMHDSNGRPRLWGDLSKSGGELE